MLFILRKVLSDCNGVQNFSCYLYLGIVAKFVFNIKAKLKELIYFYSPWNY